MNGVKYDQDKDQWHLLEPWFTQEIVKVLTLGAKKYSFDNWKYVSDARNRYYDALMRHITAWFNGEENDPEDGLSHLAHAACGIYFLRYFDLNKKENR